MLLASHLRSQQALPTCIGRPPVASRQRWAGQGGTGGERTAQLRSRRPARVFANVTSPKLANGKPQDADVNSNTTAGLVPVAGTSFEALGQMTAVPQVPHYCIGVALWFLCSLGPDSQPKPGQES